MTEGFRPAYGGQHLTPEEALALRAAGFGERVPPVLAGSALLVIDVTWGFCGKPTHATLEEAVREYPHACVPGAWQAMPNVRALVDAARAQGVPTVFTRPTPPDRRPRWHGRLEDKNTRRDQAPADTFDIVPESGWLPGDIVLDKDCPSAFFGTPLIRWLRGLRVEGVVVCGVSTSGCVRATAVDAFSFDLPTTIVGDACFDRIGVSHDVTLLDFELKYGHVLSTRQVREGWTAAAAATPPAGADGA